MALGTTTYVATMAPDEFTPPPSKKARRTHDLHPAGMERIIFGDGTGKKLTAHTTNGIKPLAREHYDESRAVVEETDGAGHGDVAMPDAREIITISSEEESDEDSEDDDDEDEAEVPQGDAVSGAERDEQDKQNHAMEPAEVEQEEPQEEPTFGELLQANHSEPIDVEALFENAIDEPTAMVDARPKVLSAPSATSLGTVLTQALKTNDRELLESCFEMTDLESVRSTIERLPSPLVSKLLQTLAERLHKRPGRAGTLMVWVQWALVSHGGYLAAQRDVTQKLASLNRVIKERANGLSSLLVLKGKLDMLNAQVELRRSKQDAARTAGAEEDEGAVIYVEGQEEEDSEDEDMGQDARATTGKPTTHPNLGDYEVAESVHSEDADDMPIMVNGIEPEIQETESEASEDEEAHDELVDIEAEETDADTGDDVSSSEEEDDEMGDFINDDEGDDLFSEEEGEEESRKPLRRSDAAQRPRF